LENRLKDLNEVVQAKNQEIKNFQNVLSTIEEMQKKAKAENERLKSDKNEAKRQRDNLQNNVLGQLEQKLDET
jgi:peptidoglycan hydrolase CwlO-like protein